MTKALEGVRVLDLTRALAGPLCGMILGDLGADVIKVEIPERGDETRAYPPFWNGESTYYLSANRSKRGMTLNLKQEEGREIFLRLVERADVVMENFRVGTMERLGLGYNALRQKHPGLIYCSISGFGRSGPRASQPGYDLLMQAFGGMMSVTGEPGRPPVRVGQSVIDLSTGMYCLAGILTALYHRRTSGQGQRVDTSLLGSQVSWLNYLAVAYFATGEAPKPTGSGHAGLVPYQAFPTADGYVAVGVGNDTQFAKLCQVLGDTSLAHDERFVTNEGRVRHRDVLVPLLEAIFKERPSQEWLRVVGEAGVPCAPVNRLDELFADPQVEHEGLVAEIPHPQIPDFRMPGSPLQLSETPTSAVRHPPLLGEHNQEILVEELGYHPDDLERLRNQGVI